MQRSFGRSLGRITGWKTAVLALTALLAPDVARADIAPPPDSPESKRVPATVEIDWGVFADRVSRRHVVAAGETLRSIAAKKLGNAAHVKAIVANNADVIQDPDRIRVGDVLWLPPPAALLAETKPPKSDPTPPPAPAPAPPLDPTRAPLPSPTPSPAQQPAATPSLAPWYDAFWLESTGYRGRGGQFLTARTSPGEPAKSALALLPHPAAVAAIAALAKGPVPTGTTELAGMVLLGMGSDTLVHRDDPTTRVVTTYKLTGVEGSSLIADSDRVRYDKDGKAVTQTWIVPRPGYAPSPTIPAATTQSNGAPTGSDSPAVTPAMAPALAATTVPTPSDDGSHWPTSTGVLVAAAGAIAVATLWALNRKRAAPPPVS